MAQMRGARAIPSRIPAQSYRQYTDFSVPREIIVLLNIYEIRVLIAKRPAPNFHFINNSIFIAYTNSDKKS
jgi:hypothetical protein